MCTAASCSMNWGAGVRPKRPSARRRPPPGAGGCASRDTSRRSSPTSTPRWATVRAGGRADDAIREYQRAITLGPTFADLRYRLARLLLESGRTLEAREVLEQVVRDRPGFHGCPCRAGACPLPLGRWFGRDRDLDRLPRPAAGPFPGGAVSRDDGAGSPVSGFCPAGTRSLPVSPPRPTTRNSATRRGPGRLRRRAAELGRRAGQSPRPRVMPNWRRRPSIAAIPRPGRRLPAAGEADPTRAGEAARGSRWSPKAPARAVTWPRANRLPALQALAPDRPSAGSPSAGDGGSLAAERSSRCCPMRWPPPATEPRSTHCCSLRRRLRRHHRL